MIVNLKGFFQNNIRVFVAKRIWLLFIICVFSCKQEPKNTQLYGPVSGPAYAIKYHSGNEHNFQPLIGSLFKVINQTMSTYMHDSAISKLNRSEDNGVVEHFIKVFDASNQIYK